MNLPFLEYRIIVVPKTSLPSFDLTVASATPEVYTTKIVPNGSNITQVLTSTSVDFLGNPIVENKPYHAFVLSVSTNNIADDALSAMSNELTLTSSTVDGIDNLRDVNINLYIHKSDILIENASEYENLFIKVYSMDGKEVANERVEKGMNNIATNYKGLVIIEFLKWQ